MTGTYKYQSGPTYPPRPGLATRWDSPVILSLKTKNWVGQLKINGVRCLIERTSNGFKFWNRHSQPLSIPGFHNGDPIQPLAFLESLKVSPQTLLDGELVRTSKGFDYYIFDVLADEGYWVWGTKLTNRIQKLAAKFPVTEVNNYVGVYAPNLYVIQNILSGDWAGVWDTLVLKQVEKIEGMVFKDPNGIMEPTFKDGNNGSWTIKCRRDGTVK